MLPPLMGFDYGDSRSMEEWALHHWGEHNEVRQAIQAQGKGNLIQRELYPVNWEDWQALALRHQLAHNEENGVLGIAGTDLQGVNFRDKREAEEWHFSHFREHLEQRTALKI